MERPKGMHKATWRKVQRIIKEIDLLHSRGTYHGKRLSDNEVRLKIRELEKSIYHWRH